MNIRPAVESEAQLLSALVMRAKAHWGYSAEQLERWRPQLTVSPSDIFAKPTFIAMVGEEKWQKGMSVFCKPFTAAKIRYYDHTRIEEARAWLNAG